MVRKFRWCLPPVARLFGGGVLHARSIILLPPRIRTRVREWCESQWGHAGAGHGWSPGGVYRAPRCENEFLHSTVLLHPLSQVNVKRVQAIVPCVILCVCLCCLKLILRNRSGETDPGVGAL